MFSKINSSTIRVALFVVMLVMLVIGAGAPSAVGI
jgi:hypothetical protein